MRRAPLVTTRDNFATGRWRPVVLPRHAGFYDGRYPDVLDLSMVRSVPTIVESLSSTDPFGPSTASLRFPGITLLDEPGAGDLWWLVGDMSVDIIWRAADGSRPYVWEGVFSSFDWSESETGHSLTVQCQGAMLPLGHYLAMPLYPYQPIPYETEIRNQFKNRYSLRLSKMPAPVFPDWWTRTYTASYWNSLSRYRRPKGMRDGQKWTGLLTRNTGEFGSALEHVQALLGNMFTERGQWTVMLDQGRVPVLRHRERITSPQPDTLVVDMLKPGMSITQLSRDHSQKVSAVYANGTTLKGVTFNGMRVSPDGSKTWYEPYAYRKEVHPITEDNPWRQKHMMRREVSISFADGASESEAYTVAEQHLARYSDPGMTASMMLTTDPELHGGGTYPRQIVHAGQSVLVRNLLGRSDGVLFHISEAQYGSEGTSVTLDTKYRDQLTVQEVRARGRDSLAPVRLLSINQYAPTQQDLLFPWSYARGSGYMPRGSRPLFSGMPDDMEFPWEDWTRRRPPKDPTWAADYIRIPRRDADANKNWAKMPSSTQNNFVAYPIRMSQAGEAKLLQVAAYDANGNVMKVGFHISFYSLRGIQYTAMPMLNQANAKRYGYGKGQRYPFFQGAFESRYADGRLVGSMENNLQSAGLMAGWGNYYEKAGYWPGSSSVAGSGATGMLSLNNPGLQWDLTGGANRIDPQKSAEENLKNDSAGAADIWVMIFCEDQRDQDVYFLGRIFRAEQTAR